MADEISQLRGRLRDAVNGQSNTRKESGVNITHIVAILVTLAFLAQGAHIFRQSREQSRSNEDPLFQPFATA